MKYEMTGPCVNCPFRREGFIPLMAERVEEIAEGMLSTQGHTFACHKTTGHDDDGDRIITETSQHCGGALIFAEKNGNATQMMRICERLNMYDARKLVPNYDLVFDDLDEMLDAHASHRFNRPPVKTMKTASKKTAKKRTRTAPKKKGR